MGHHPSGVADALCAESTAFHARAVAAERKYIQARCSLSRIETRVSTLGASGAEALSKTVIGVRSPSIIGKGCWALVSHYAGRTEANGVSCGCAPRPRHLTCHHHAAYEVHAQLAKAQLAKASQAQASMGDRRRTQTWQLHPHRF